MSSRMNNVKTEALDMDSLFDFNGSTTQQSPATASSSRIDATPKSASQDWNGLSPFEQEQRQQFNGPSHDYNQYRQQVGLPAGSMSNLPPQNLYDGYGSGLGDMGFDSGFGGGWSSGIDMDAEMSIDFNNPASAMPAMFFPPQTPADNFIDPSSIGGPEEPTSNVGRLWPGMHSQQAQQAAMQKAAQVQASQQRQMKLQAQHAQYRQASQGSQTQAAPQPSQSKRPSHVTEPHVEESISRLLNQMRHNSNASADDENSPDGMLPQLARLKKDEEEMDEDERLLASDEGKKLSSKERRQLRNKVSARAFRSRRKEYIGQLEGEVAMKAQEANDLRTQNASLMHENDGYRALIETLLRHPAFTPFVQEISQDPSMLTRLQQPAQQQQQQPAATPAQQPAQPQPMQQQQQQSQQQESKPEFLNFDASQLQIPQQPHQAEQIGMAMIPENDFSKLNLNGFNGINFNNYQRVNAFAVTSVPKGPDPVDLLLDSPARLPFSCSTSTTCASGLSATAVCDSDLTVLLAKLDGAAQNLRCVRAT